MGAFTLKARATRTGCLDSDVAAATYALSEPYGPGAVSGGTAFSVVARPDGVVYGFGLNSTSQLGDGTTTLRSAPQLVQTLTGVTALATGTNYSLARTWTAACSPGARTRTVSLAMAARPPDLARSRFQD